MCVERVTFVESIEVDKVIIKMTEAIFGLLGILIGIVVFRDGLRYIRSSDVAERTLGRCRMYSMVFISVMCLMNAIRGL